ncbi:MAG: hypothetical protein ACYC7A_13655 [Thermoanaerobaculia bacterium]
MPRISWFASVAFGPDGGMAVWRVVFDGLWGVPLRPDGKPAGPARLILRDSLGTRDASVRYVDGAFTAFWNLSWPSVTRMARLSPEGAVLAIHTLDRIVTPVVPSDRLILTLGTIDNSRAVFFYDAHGQLVLTENLGWNPIGTATDAVALDDGSFALVTNRSGVLSLMRFAPDGHLVSAVPRVIDDAAGSSSIATDGQSLLIVWTAAAQGPLPVLKSVVISRDDVMSPTRTLLSDRWPAVVPEAAWGAGAYTIVVNGGRLDHRPDDDTDLYALRIGPDGEPLSGELKPVFLRPGAEFPTAAAASTTHHIVVFQQGDYGAEEIFVVAVPLSGPLTRSDVSAVDARISDSAAWQTNAVAATDGSVWLTVWLERLATREEIRSAPLAADGTPAAPPATLRSVFRYLGTPQVAFNGVDYVVFWNEGSTILAKRVRRDGTPIDETPIIVATGTAGLSVAAKDGNVLVTFGVNGIRAVFFRADGTVTPVPDAISPLPHIDGDDQITYESPVAVAGTSGFIVAWTERRSPPCYFPACFSTTRAEARLVTNAAMPSSDILHFGSAEPGRAAAARGSYLFLQSGGVVIIRETDAEVVLLKLAAATSYGQPLGTHDGVIVPLRPAMADAIHVQSLTPDGTDRGLSRIEAFAFPVAIKPSGAMIAVGSRSTPGAPHFGAPAILSQTIDALLPPEVGRRRTVRR